jgi:hypothetical protein
MPQLRALQDRYSGQMVILGINAGEQGNSDREKAAKGVAAARRLQLNFPVLPNGDAQMERYAANGFPTTYLVDPSGRIVEAQSGANPELWRRVEATVSRFHPRSEAREGTGGPRKAAQITHELTFPLPSGPREWVVGREVTFHFNRPEGIPADLVSLSVDGAQVAIFGVGGSYTWDATGVKDGPHKLRIAAQTASGRETWATDQLVLVDNRPPINETPTPTRRPGSTRSTPARSRQ